MGLGSINVKQKINVSCLVHVRAIEKKGNWKCDLGVNRKCYNTPFCLTFVPCWQKDCKLPNCEELNYISMFDIDYEK